MKPMKSRQRRLIASQEIGHLVLELSKYAVVKIPVVESGQDLEKVIRMSMKNYLRIRENLAVAEDNALVRLIHSWNHPEDGMGNRRTEMEIVPIDSLTNREMIDILLVLLETRRIILITN